MFKVLVICVVLILSGCTSSLPDRFDIVGEKPLLYPDYTDVTIPYNIASMNFLIQDTAENYRTCFRTKKDSLIVSGRDVKVDLSDWHRILRRGKNDTLYIDIYMKRNSCWKKYQTIKNFISEDAIDEWISYRLIEPGFASYDRMALCQRNLTSFDEQEIFNNSRLSSVEKGQCINCHTPRNYNKSRESQFHVRGQYGGTVILQSQCGYKVNLKVPEVLSAGVYPAWNPRCDVIAYSVNETFQSFHLRNTQKIEVQDRVSDLILYNIQDKSVSHILSDTNTLETFPAWSPFGDRLYYAAAIVPRCINTELMLTYDSIHYNIYSVSFDTITMKFGEPRIEVCLPKSVTFPRVSPDGRWLLFTAGDYGTFHIWHKSADLWVMNLETKNITPLSKMNSDDTESYHSWSSTGKWIVFSSRRDDGSFTRPYIAWFGENGNTGKPFILPQKESDYYQNKYKSYNIPEFMVLKVKYSICDISNMVRMEAEKVTYKK